MRPAVDRDAPIGHGPIATRAMMPAASQVVSVSVIAGQIHSILTRRMSPGMTHHEQVSQAATKGNPLYPGGTQAARDMTAGELPRTDLPPGVSLPNRPGRAA